MKFKEIGFNHLLYSFSLVKSFCYLMNVMQIVETRCTSRTVTASETLTLFQKNSFHKMRHKSIPISFKNVSGKHTLLMEGKF